MTADADIGLRARAAQIFELLGECYPNAGCELNYADPFQLLVATVLSAQSTDRRVNAITPELFARYPDPYLLARAEREDVEEIVRPVGFFRAKTEALLKLSAEIVSRFDGAVPDTLDDLVTLQGVGRKTANVVLGNAFGIPGLTPDTHFMRVARRLGFTSATRPDPIENDVAELFDPDDWVQVSHRLIWHGRRRCHARNPACGVCPVDALCPSFGVGEPDPSRAVKLVREPRR